MLWYLQIGVLVGCMWFCNGGVLEHRVRRSEDRCGRDFSTGPGTVTLPTEEYNNTGTHMYSKLADCYWSITTDTPGAYIMLTSEYFDLEYSDDCLWDYVEITENGDRPAINRFCGWDPVTYISASNDIMIKFGSDDSYESKGFSFYFEIKDSVDDTKCNSTIYGPDPGEIASSGDAPCFYNIRADEGKVIELELSEVDFGGGAHIDVYKGFSGQGNPLRTFYNTNASTGFIGVRESSFFIAYYNDEGDANGGFRMRYTFVVDNFTPAPVPPTTPSPVGGNNDCSGLFIDPENGEMTYTTPTFQDKRDCIVVIRNTLFTHHVVEITFTKFDMEESDDCMFDWLKIRTGERENSAMLGGSYGKLYCGDELKGKTLTTNGNSLRLEFHTDESLSFFGFRAKIKFVPSKVCDCGKGGMVCVRTGLEKVCEPGSECTDFVCQNGGKCVSHKGQEKCICRTGFSGTDCSEREGDFEAIRFTNPPENKQLVREDSHFEQCQAEVIGSPALVNYIWTFDGKIISPYVKAKGFGSVPGGVLRIDSFTDQMEGIYSCIASTDSGASAEQVFEYDLIESCPAGIEFGPRNEEKKVGDEVLLPCYAPTAVSVVWKKDGRPVDLHNKRFTKMVNNYLQIIELEELDAGVYRCEARSRTGCYGYREGTLSVIDVKPLNSFCGRTIYDEAVDTAISMGSVAQPGAYPWHVVFRGVKHGSTVEETFCGGSLISEKWVMTAAHCVTEFKVGFKQDFGSRSVNLYLGATDCFGTGGISRRPGRVVKHENFQDFAYMNSDIALIELSSPVEYTDSIRPICLEPARYNDRVFFGEEGHIMMTYGKVAGCGYDWRGAKKRDLMEISIPYVDRNDCEDMFDKHRASGRFRIPENFMLTDNMICAGNEVRRTGDTCKGDSGGALVMVAQNRWVQTGIVSFGIGCDRGNYGVYTNVGRYYEWIKQHTDFDQEFI